MNGSGTRSSLMYETIRIVQKLKPKYVIWENVKNLLSKKHKHNFDKYVDIMNEGGYNSYYQVLNAKDYGIPQNRERVFTISILGGGEFGFPEKQELKLRLKDMLEEQVDEKYYLSEKIVNFYYKNEAEQKAKGNGFTFGVSDGNKVARAITTRAGSRMDDNFIKSKNKRLLGLIEKTKFEDGKVLNMDLYNQTTNENISQCLPEPNHNSQSLYDGLRIRKLTPKECWRLMGFTDEEFEKAEKVNSNTQLYKQAGNSIVVNVLEEIFKNLLKENE